jgi:hypothetical protein
MSSALDGDGVFSRFRATCGARELPDNIRSNAGAAGRPDMTS